MSLPSLRKAAPHKAALKEKVVQIYEAFFQGEDPSVGKSNFWEELFLLKVNGAFIEAELEMLNGESLLSLKENINLLFYKCVTTLKQDNQIRTFNAIQTLCALIRGVFKKSRGDVGFDVINILIGFDAAEVTMQSLVESINALVIGENSHVLKQVSIRLLIVLVAATDNVSQNTILEYLMINSVFETLIQILGSASARLTLGSEAVLLLTLLVQYRKYESANPYIVKLSILDQELALTGYAQVVSSVLSDFNRDYRNRHCEAQTAGWLTSFTSMVGNWFIPEEKIIESVRANDSILLALYEAIHLNRNFITALTHSHTPSSPPNTPPDSPPMNAANPSKHSYESQGQAEEMDPHPACQPTNLLVSYLEYSSIVIQDTRDERRHNNAKLCLVILTCIAEDQYANSLMHDINMPFRVPLHKAPMRHRKYSGQVSAPSRPIVCSLLDLMTEFIQSHMMKNFPMELYLRCLGIVHRVLCYQKKCRVRLQYPWKDTWTALMNLLKFIVSHESQLVKKHNIFIVSSRVVNLVNLFITYGDTFLPCPDSYDQLYYEIVRRHHVFDNLYSMALRYTTNNGEWKDAAVRLSNHLGNIRAIINHFTPKVDAWAVANHVSSLTEDQVLSVVRTNYDSLTLKLQDSLDQYERYSETPREVSFFTQLVRSIIGDVRKFLSQLSITQHDLLVHELSTLPS